MKHSPIVLHRLLFAVRPPLTLARQIEQSAIWFRPGATRVRADNLHITLEIFEDHPTFPERLAEVLMEAGKAVAAEPVEIVLDQVSGSKRSVALRPRRRIPALDQLYKAIALEVKRAGLTPRPDYSFSPHVTVLYRDGAPFTQAIDPIRWTADELVLVHSLVGRTRHDVLGRWRLRGSRQYALL
ncbi:2'-5' RNA ligase family protein [Sphingomonas cavernae]|nr:2'-5' RNA ligase family protein [Sphingomonas cavernae]